MSLYADQEVHNRLSILSHKDIKLPHIDERRGLSTTKVLELIKQKKTELFPSLYMSDSE